MTEEQHSRTPTRINTRLAKAVELCWSSVFRLPCVWTSRNAPSTLNHRHDRMPFNLEEAVCCHSLCMVAAAAQKTNTAAYGYTAAPSVTAQRPFASWRSALAWAACVALLSSSLAQGNRCAGKAAPEGSTPGSFCSVALLGNLSLALLLPLGSRYWRCVLRVSRCWRCTFSRQSLLALQFFSFVAAGAALSLWTPYALLILLASLFPCAFSGSPCVLHFLVGC